MASTHLATYLNNHLAGSVMALELLDYIAAVFKGTETERFASELHDEVAADKKTLEEFMARFNIGLSVTRRASAWVGEKFAQLKLILDDPKGGSFRLLEATEALVLGIEGKKALWRALSTASETSPEIRVLDYEQLIQRADEQRNRVERVRLKAAESALTSRG